MDNIQFYKSFGFNSYSFTNSKHTDNSSGTRAHHIGVVCEGSAVFDVEGEIHRFSKGDVFYTPLGCRYHSYWSGERIEYKSFSFMTLPSADNCKYKIQRLTVSETGLFALSELEKDMSVNARSIGLFYLLLGEALPLMEKEISDPKRELMNEALSYIGDNLGFSARDLARHLKISESGLYALFAQFGTTPVDEKNRIRCEKASVLLRNTDLSVDRISDVLGFSSAAYLRKVLRRTYGKTPSEMRQSKGL